MKKTLCILLFAFKVNAQALTGQEILERMDKTNNDFADQMMEVTMVVVDTNGSKKSYDFTIWQKGLDKRLVRFTSGENKGLGFLVQDRDHVYVYMPGMKKVRRVAAHNMNQTVAGSDMTNDEMATASWPKVWDAAIEKEDDQHYYLSLTPKKGQKTVYPKAKMVVIKGSFVQKKVEYFDENGNKVKSWDNSNPKDFNGIQRNTLVVITDLRTGHKTELHIKDFKYNIGLKDDMFTERELEWGR